MQAYLVDFGLTPPADVEESGWELGQTQVPRPQPVAGIKEGDHADDRGKPSMELLDVVEGEAEGVVIIKHSVGSKSTDDMTLNGIIGHFFQVEYLQRDSH